MLCFACCADFTSHAAVPKALAPRISWCWQCILRGRGMPRLLWQDAEGRRAAVNAWTATLTPGANFGANTDLRMKNSGEGAGWTRGCPTLPPSPSSRGASLQSTNSGTAGKSRLNFATTAGLSPCPRELAAEETAQNSGTVDGSTGFGLTRARAAFLPAVCHLYTQHM